MALRTKIVRTIDDLALFEPAWRDLLGRSRNDEPTLTPLWLGAWWRVFGSEGGRRLCVTLFFEGDRLVGIAPLQTRRHWYRPGIPFRRLELLASGEHESDEICSEYIGVIAEQGREVAVVEALTATLLGGGLGAWGELVLPAMDGESPIPWLLANALERVGIATETEVMGSCPYIQLPSSWDDYLASLSSAGRYLVTRSLRVFDEWADGSAELHAARSAAELDAGRRVLAALHGERWGRSGRTGAFRSPRFAAFHDEVMQRLLAEGALELLWLTVRGDPVAVVYNILWKGKVYFYQSGRMIDVPKGVRPGIVMHARAIQRAIATGRREYDFLAGASQYKMQLATAARSLVRVRAVRSSVLELARRAADGGIDRGRHLRDLVRSANRQTERQQVSP
jgi:CelD/BcsL family acetyltransferase involved in cellulose biosynthesis